MWNNHWFLHTHFFSGNFREYLAEIFDKYRISQNEIVTSIGRSLISFLRALFL